MSRRWRVYIDEIGQALVEAVRASVGEDLGLRVWDQGDMRNLPAASDLDTVLPMMLVEFLDASLVTAFPNGPRAQVVYNFRIRLFRRVADGDNARRVMQQAMSLVVGAIGSTENFLLEALDGTAGLQINHAFPKKFEAENVEEAALRELRHNVSVGWIDVEVDTESQPYDS